MILSFFYDKYYYNININNLLLYLILIITIIINKIINKNRLRNGDVKGKSITIYLKKIALYS